MDSTMSIVWTNGTFDILHPGHIELFKVARSLGDKVIVATDTDAKIKRQAFTIQKQLSSLQQRPNKKFNNKYNN